MTKDELIKLYHESIVSAFVNNYDMIKNSMDIINTHMMDLSIDYQYEYDIYCVEFLNNSDFLLKQLSLDELKILSINDHTKIILMRMVDMKTEYFNAEKARNKEIVNVIDNLKKNSKKE